MPCAFAFAFARAGNSSPARMAMIAMTTSSSISVNPLALERPETWRRVDGGDCRMNDISRLGFRADADHSESTIHVNDPRTGAGVRLNAQLDRLDMIKSG